MSVICDTSKVSIVKNGDFWSAYILGKKNEKGNSLIFSLSKYDASLSKELLYTIFFEKLEGGEFKTRRGSVLRQNEKGELYLERNPNAPAKGTILAEIAEKSAKANGPVTRGQILFDPHTPEARALIGKAVTGSTTFGFNEGTCFVGTLDSLNGAFHIKMASGMVRVPFIKERRPQPLNFNDQTIRRSLLGKVIVSRDGNHELMITSFVKDGNNWKANGINATMMMNQYTYEDGSEIMTSA